MGEFKKGDRVRVIGPLHGNSRFSDRLYGHSREVGTILEIMVPNLRVKMERDGNTGWVHPKQCRRLVKRERRRVWLPKTWSSAHREDLKREGWAFLEQKPADALLDLFIEFIEVSRKGKR